MKISPEKHRALMKREQDEIKARINPNCGVCGGLGKVSVLTESIKPIGIRRCPVCFKGYGYTYPENS